MAYILVRRDSEFVDSPVFHAGEGDTQEAIVVFSCSKKANAYLRTAGWELDHEVGQLLPLQLLRWLFVAKENGVDMIVIDPDRKRQLEGQSQASISLAKPYAAFATLVGKQSNAAPQPHGEFSLN